MEANEILSEVKSLSRLRRACTYHKVDLHVHSPASSDYTGDKDISPYDFVSAFVARGFHMIAITDHNAGTFIDSAIEARNRIESDEGNRIVVLPGVELYVSPGVHVLAILPGGGSAAVSDLLSRLELPIEHHGDITKLIRQSIGDISRAVHEREGIVIGAHCNSTHGVVNELSGQARLEWLRELDAIEINSAAGDDKVSSTTNYVSNELGVMIPYTFGSDSHDCTIDLMGMWVKMAEPSLASLKQLIFEPQLRVSRDEPIPPSYGRIVGFTSTHGIYANQRFRFSPHLNVLLGGRGAGKSAAIDLLRFAFGAEPNAGDVNEEVFSNRIKGFLQSVGEVSVVVVGNDGNVYVIVRPGNYEVSGSRSRVTFTETPRVYQVSGENLIERELRPIDVLGVEFYGQGEVARLADRVEEQMRLIDENLDYSEDYNSIVNAELELKTGEEQLVQHKQRLEELRVKVASRPRLEERRNHLLQSLSDPVFEERTRWDQERTWLQGQQDWLQSILNELPLSISTYSDISIEIEKSTAKAILEKVRETSERILGSGRKDLERFRNMLTQAITELQGYRSEWNTAFENAENQYRARLAELGAADLAAVAAEHRNVEEEIRLIDTNTRPEMEQIESDVSALESNRALQLVKLGDARAAIASSRSRFVEELNSRLGGDVIVDLSKRDRSLFFESVDKPLQGSGMQHREDQILLACAKFTPEKFVEIMRSGLLDQLTAIGITENNASRMKNGLSDDDLYRIERVDIPQLPSIRVKREGETEYTDLSSLSVGEKCSAILSIALLSKDKPLVIDQPEDDLDHAFIINSIVEGIRTAKSERQIISATHNPNIPVLGDAEMVFRVARKAGDDVCQIQNSGGLELPQVTVEVQSLEGGPEAFERRRRRYSGVF